jgi:YihY family inner membrane protein
VSSVRAVPETTDMDGEELSADDAWLTLRRHGSLAFLNEAFTRFRYGDGFSHARAFGLQLALAAAPLVIAMAGLANAVGAEGIGEVIARTVVAISPGSSDALVEQAVERSRDGGEVGELALVLGLLTAFVATMTAFAQLERGANRVYGTERDRPALRKYLRAAALTATAGGALTVGLLLIVAGEPFGDAMEEVYGWGDTADDAWDVLRWPAGLVSLVAAVTLLQRFAPRRRQPGWSWLAVGSSVTVVGWLIASGLLAVYVALSDAFGETYGPLTAVMALLIWSNLTGVALLAGVALSAQLEALRAGEGDPRLPDRDADGVPDG